MSDSAAKRKRLYKYEPFTEQSLQNLKAWAINFGSPKNINDQISETLQSRSSRDVSALE